MTNVAPAAPASRPTRDDLAPRILRALFDCFALHTADGTYIVVPATGPDTPATDRVRPPGKGPGR